MGYFFRSICTFSFWRYALFSQEAVGKLLASIGVLWLFMELMDFLSIYTKDQYSKFAIIPIVIFSAIYVVITRRPVSRIIYKIPNRDYVVEVRIGNVFEQQGDIVISSNTTFDTDMASGLISPDSLQGQLAINVFGSNTRAIDEQLDAGLRDVAFTSREDAPGKTREYPIGTTVKVSNGANRAFYFVAMARLSNRGTAQSSVRDVEDALEALWRAIAAQGDLRPICVPLMGTGRGRIELPRKKVVERIAQSFADASADAVFSNRLVIVIRAEDAKNFAVNLFEVRDFLVRALHT